VAANCFAPLSDSQTGSEMIEAFSLATAHLFQDALASQASLRHRVFVQQRSLPHSHFEGLEYDEFDTPSAVYLVWRDRSRVVRGLVRLLRTDRPYMLKSYWPELVSAGQPPASADVWEMTRVCVDKAVEPAIRRTILPELLTAAKEFFDERRAAGMVGVTRAHLLSHFVRQGIVWLGEPATVEGETERAFFVPTCFVRPNYHCKKYGIPSSVLECGSGELRRNAA
jgi:N-acyl-L-homoserine lactone synthetase